MSREKKEETAAISLLPSPFFPKKGVVVIRLVAFDLDGTLLHQSNRPSEASLSMLRELVDRGIAVASISGRNFERNQVPFPRDLADALYVGCYNGALAFSPRKNGVRRLMYTRRLSEDVFAELMAYTANRGLNFVYCKCDVDGDAVREVYITDRDTEQGRAVAAMTEMVYEVDATLPRRILNGTFENPPKIMLLPEPDDLQEMLSDLRRIFGDRIYTAWAVAGRVEVMHSDVSKERALRAIAEHAGVPMSQVMAIGDGNNDLPMLDAAGVGVLMGNADLATQDAVAGSDIHIALRVDEEGFAESVRRFVLEPHNAKAQ